jgi:hypothetical protein
MERIKRRKNQARLAFLGSRHNGLLFARFEGLNEAGETWLVTLEGSSTVSYAFSNI